MKYPNDFINKIICGDCIDVMKVMPDSSVDLTVTSPPYDNLRDYNGYKFDFKVIAKQLFRVAKNGGVVVWVVGDATIKGSESGTSFKQALYFKKIGFNIHDTMIYQKNSYPFPPSNRYFSVFEYMFVLSKGAPKITNLIKVSTVGYKSKSATSRQKDGSIVAMRGAMGKDTRVKDNIWKYDVGYNLSTKDKIAFKHPATFPDVLAERHIISWSNENDIVYDPFMGSGTTAKMALKNKRKYIGSELSKEYCDIAEQRINTKLTKE